MLKRLEQSAWRRSLTHYDPFAPVTAWDLGRVSEAASAADDAIFHVLATARANCHVKMTDAQLFGPDPAHAHETDEQHSYLETDAADAQTDDEDPAAAATEPAVEAEAPTDQDNGAEALEGEPPREENGTTGTPRRPRRPIHAV